MTISDDNKGVIYLAFGYDYLIQAISSVKSLKLHHPDLSASIVTNIQINNIKHCDLFDNSDSNRRIFDKIIHVDDTSSTNRQYKTQISQYSPYRYTLFIDCDTEIRGNIEMGFEYLENFELALISSPVPPYHMVNWWEDSIQMNNIDLEDSPFFGSGIIFFDCDNTEEFFREWNRKYNELEHSKDQYSLLHTIYTTDVQVLPLNLIWNTSDTNLLFTNGIWRKQIEKNTKIYHYSVPRINKWRRIEEEIGETVLKSNKKDRRRKLRQKYDKKSELISRLKLSEGLRRIYFSSVRPILVWVGVKLAT
jgi:hypothetical protein